MKRMSYRCGAYELDSIELKCMMISRGILVNPQIYDQFSERYRINPSPVACNCLLLPDRTVVQLTDLGLQLRHLAKTLSWDEAVRSEYAAQLGTPFSLTLEGDKPMIAYQGEVITEVSFPPHSNFYLQKTSDGSPYIGNAVLQGLDWVSFQCLWPCEYGAAGKPCQFCFSGGEFQVCAERGRPLPDALSYESAAEIVRYAFERERCTSIQLTGGSTFSGRLEQIHISAYLEAIAKALNLPGVLTGSKMKSGPAGRGGDLLLYITPPDRMEDIDHYFSLGATKIACSIEVWDEERARVITPGKMEFTTRQRHLEVLSYIAAKYGPGKAFSNFIIGLEGLDTLRAGAEYLAARGIIPTASVWMPMGRPVMGSMQPPDWEFYRRAKELYAELYTKYRLEPAGCCGLNVCIERDVWRYASGAECGCADEKQMGEYRI